MLVKPIKRRVFLGYIWWFLLTKTRGGEGDHGRASRSKCSWGGFIFTSHTDRHTHTYPHTHKHTHTPTHTLKHTLLIPLFHLVAAVSGDILTPDSFSAVTF